MFYKQPQAGRIPTGSGHREVDESLDVGRGLMVGFLLGAAAWVVLIVVAVLIAVVW